MPQRKWNLGDIRSSDRAPVDRGVRTRGKPPIQDIRPPVVHTPLGGTIAISSESDRDQSESPREYRARRGGSPNGGRGRKALFFCVIVLVFLGIVFLATLFSQNAELTVYPKFKEVAVKAALTAYQNPTADMLGYELLTLEETGERTVAATGAEPMEEHATGELTIYNAWSKNAQRLIKNTRFESADGHIFRISDSVVVPGYTVNGTEKVPGTIIAKVFADATGATYNIAAGHFTIPGLKGTPQFAAVYGESKSPMQGGFVGTRLIVADNELARTKEQIQTELKDRLLGRLRKERPAGFVLYDSAARVTFDSLPSVDAGEKRATIREHATLEAPLFAENDFARYLAQHTIAGYGKEEVRVENPQSLTFSYVTASSTEATTGTKKIDFTLAGNAKIVWKYDTEKLRKDLAGTTKEELLNILLNYQPAIERATTVMRPFWKQSFPKKSEKIKIIEILDSGEK